MRFDSKHARGVTCAVDSCCSHSRHSRSAPSARRVVCAGPALTKAACFRFTNTPAAMHCTRPMHGSIPAAMSRPASAAFRECRCIGPARRRTTSVVPDRCVEHKNLKTQAIQLPELKLLAALNRRPRPPGGASTLLQLPRDREALMSTRCARVCDRGEENFEYKWNLCFFHGLELISLASSSH